MLKWQDLPSSEKSAAVVYQLVVICLKHIYIYLGKIQFLQFYKAFVGFIEDPSLTRKDNIPFAAVFLLTFLIPEMVSFSDLGKIVHFLGP
mgnify:CR=1 FL=1